MTTYPRLMEIISEKTVETLYNTISDWHSKEIRDTNKELGKFSEALWKIMKEFPRRDEQGAYEVVAMLNFIENARRTFTDLGWKDYLPDEE